MKIHVVILFSLGILLAAGARSAAVASPCPDARVSPDLPSAVTLSKTFPPYDIALQNDFDCFSWESFVALNWPASTSGNGVPDRSKPFGRLGDNGLVVWETYKQPVDVFRPLGENPCPACPAGSPDSCYQQCWNERPSIPEACLATEGIEGARITVLDGFAQASPNAWLTDQNRNLVRYDIRLNEAEFMTIVPSGLYSRQGQRTHGAFRLPNGVTGGSVGALETKSAWRILTDADDRSRYLSQKTLLVDHKLSPTLGWPDPVGGVFPTCNKAGEGPCCVRDMGLVGFHIAHKSMGEAPGSNILMPQWVWSTFEHVDNAPIEGEPVDAAVKYSFYNPRCPEEDPLCRVNFNPRNQVGAPVPIFENPVQVIRNPVEPPFATSADEVNALWRRLVVDTPFQNYELVSTQWPSDPGTADPATTDGDPDPAILANSTMETYMQPQSSCIGCHKLAVTAVEPYHPADFSFLFGDAE